MVILTEAAPGATFAGTFTLIWVSPAKPGAAPANGTSASCPPMAAVTGSLVRSSVPAGFACPSTDAGSVWQVPVAHSETTDPRVAGRAAEFSEPSWFNATAGPSVARLVVNSAGFTDCTVIELWSSAPR